jgi:ComF family protein
VPLVPEAVRRLAATRPLRAAAGVLRDVEALLLPVVCLGCQQPLTPAEDVCCTACRNRMRRIAPPVCGRCGQPVDAWERQKRQAGRRSETTVGARRSDFSDRLTACGFCRHWPPELAWATSAVWLEDGPARELAHALKYGGWTCAARPMADAIARACGPALPRDALLIPIPLGRARERERGHNQAAELARALGERLGTEVRAGVLRRARETRTQTELSRMGRWRNVAGAFVAGDGVRGRTVVLVDDVLTTGATLAVAARALVQAGAAEAGAVTFGRALVPR